MTTPGGAGDTPEMLGPKLDKLKNFFNRLLSGQRKANLDIILDESRKWQPDPTVGNYKDEMATRMQYLRGAMQADMKIELKRRFPQTYEKIWKEQVNLPLVKKEIRDKAKCFLSNGEVYLVDEKGVRVEGDDQDKFQEVMSNSQLWSAFTEADAVRQTCHRCMVKPWWDTKAEQVRISIWSPNKVDIWPNPDRWWDVDSAYAVLFELPGTEGKSSTYPRREVWGIRDPEAAAVTGKNTVHFITDGINDKQVNSDDVNPFVDPRTGGPAYPFVWWRDDASTDLYTIGNEDKLTVNRRINSVLTDLMQAIHYQAFPVAVHSMGPEGKELGKHIVSPGDVIDLAPGASLDFLNSNLPIESVFKFCQDLADASAKLEGLSSTAIRSESGTPETGYALSIRQKPLREHRKEMLGFTIPDAEETAYRVAIVHNTYAEPKEEIKGLERYSVRVEPGEFEIDEDPEAKGRRYLAQIEANVSTAAEYRAEIKNETLEDAEKKVLENAEKNKELAEAGRAELPPALQAANAEADKLFNKKDKKDDEGKEDEDEG